MGRHRAPGLPRAAVLAVDGGNSKTDAALLDGRGRLLGAARGAGSSPQTSGSNALANLRLTVEAACAAAGVDPETRPVARIGVYCMAGVDLPVDERRALASVRSLGLSARDVVLNDTFAVLRAGTDRGWGVGVVCGAGINCVGVSPTRRRVRFPALGAISGDRGSGHGIGLEALGAAVRGRDRRGPRTALERAVPAHFGLSTPAAVSEAIYLGRLPDERLWELAPVVMATAGDGDREAGRILDWAADEIVAMAVATIRRLGMRRLDVDVVLGGGVLGARDARVLRRVADGIHRVAPAARMHVLGVPPVAGAALIGLDHLAAARSGVDGDGKPVDASVAARVRTAITHETMRGGAMAAANAGVPDGWEG